MANSDDGGASEGEANADYPPPFWPVGLRVGLGIFPVPVLGIGAVLILDQSTRSDAVDVAPQDGEERIPGPTTQVFVGPQLRILSSVASGRRAGELRIAPQFAMAFGQSSPWAGSKYVSDFGFLDAGTFSMQHLGVHVEVAGKVELSPKVALRLSGELGIYVPSGPDRIGVVDPPASMDKTWVSSVDQAQLVAGEHGVSVLPGGGLVDDGVIEVQEKVELFPQLVEATRLYAAGRAAILVPHPKANLAVGPFFEVGLHATGLVFPNSADDVWYQRGRELKRTSRLGKAARDVVLLALNSGIGDKYERKVFSTRRHDLLFRVGVEMHFGVGLFRAPKK